MFLNMSQVLDAADVYETRLRRGCTPDEGHLEGGREYGLEMARLGANHCMRRDPIDAPMSQEARKPAKSSCQGQLPCT